VTVAAVVVAGSADEALADAAGRPAARRIAELAWAGGATPIVVVAPDADGQVAAALGGSEAELVVGVPPDAPGVGDGVRQAVAKVGATAAVLIWPASHPWVGAETITSLIEAHGRTQEAILRPTWDGASGWPVLAPVDALPAVDAADASALLAGLVGDGRAVVKLDLGDPGVVIGIDTPIEALPPYRGPAGPMAAPPDWGAAVSDLADEGS
jgi:CTP:molybdopterin cytidylyltransferase MocA